MSVARNTPHIPSLDGLRGMACLLVVWAHATEMGWQSWFSGIEITGQIGVMIFFTLSGFLMADLYLPGSYSWRHWLGFLIRRMFRIYPAYLFVTLLLWLSYQFSFPVEWNFDSRTLFQHLSLQDALFKFWTIPVEIKFYGIFPFLGCALLMMKPYLKIGTCVMIWIGYALLASRQELSKATTELTPFASFFMGGIIMALLSKSRFLCQVPLIFWNFFALLSFIFPAVAVYYRWHIIDIPIFAVWQYTYVLSPLIALLVFAIAQSSGKICQLFANHVSRFLGKISYSVYLVHFFIFDIARHYVTMTYFKWCLIFAITLFLSWILYITVEKPLTNMGKKLTLSLTLKQPKLA